MHTSELMVHGGEYGREKNEQEKSMGYSSDGYILGAYGVADVVFSDDNELLLDSGLRAIPGVRIDCDECELFLDD